MELIFTGIKICCIWIAASFNHRILQKTESQINLVFNDTLGDQNIVCKTCFILLWPYPKPNPRPKPPEQKSNYHITLAIQKE